LTLLSRCSALHSFVWPMPRAKRTCTGLPPCSLGISMPHIGAAWRECNEGSCWTRGPSNYFWISRFMHIWGRLDVNHCVLREGLSHYHCGPMVTAKTASGYSRVVRKREAFAAPTSCIASRFTLCEWPIRITQEGVWPRAMRIWNWYGFL
jgi:hypothetical protein